MEQCLICRSSMRLAFRATVLDKYPVAYLFCSGCGHLRTEAPHWLAEAYGSFDRRADMGAVQRNLSLATVCTSILFHLFDHTAPFLDAGGGTGLLTRLLRDAGFDCHWEDRYAANLFAAGFEAKAAARYEAVTAFEVLEHLPDPMAFIEAQLDRSTQRTLIFMTELFSEPVPSPDEWLYYGFKTGQHISFLQARTLRFIASSLGVSFASAEGIHVLSAKQIDEARLGDLVRRAGWHAQAARRALTSKLDSDVEAFMLASGRALKGPRRAP